MEREQHQAAQVNVYGLFRGRALSTPDAVALEEGSRQISYAQLLKRVDRLAGLLSDHSIGRGDRVAILSHNRSEYIELELAAAARGTIVACLNWRLAEPELRHCVKLVQPRLILAEAELAPALATIPDASILTFGPDYEGALAAASPGGMDGRSEEH